ncbi:MAG: hypothetical protein Roseis2KO_09060 [Roseivirga sp.]
MDIPKTDPKPAGMMCFILRKRRTDHLPPPVPVVPKLAWGYNHSRQFKLMPCPPMSPKGATSPKFK